MITTKLFFLAALIPLLLVPSNVNATTLTPSDKEICKNADISLSDCIKVVQERAAAEAEDKLALSKITPKTANYVVQLVTGDQTSWTGYVGPGGTAITGTGSQSYTIVCSTTPTESIAYTGYYETVKITSSADNPPSLTLNLLYNGQIINSTTVHQDFVDANITNSGCPSTK